MTVLKTLVIIVAVHYVLSGITRVIRAWREPNSRNTQRPGTLVRTPTRFDRVSSAILLVGALCALIAVGLAQRSHLSLDALGIRVDTPAFAVRNAFRDYIAERHGLFTEYPTEEEYERFQAASGSSDPAAETLLSRDSHAQHSYLRDYRLYTQVRSRAFRTAYLRFGPAIVLGCDWCRSDSAYAVYGLTHTVKDYAIFLAVLGAGTANSRFRRWRTYASLAAALFGVIELIHLLALGVESPQRGIQAADILGEVGLPAIAAARRAIFAILLVLGALVFNTASTVVESDVILHLVRGVHDGFAAQQAAGFVRAAVMTDGELRSRTMANANRRAVLAESMQLEPAFRDARRRAMHGPEGFRDALRRAREALALGLRDVLAPEEQPRGEPLRHPEEAAPFWLEDFGPQLGEDASLGSAEVLEDVPRPGAERRGSSLAPLQS